MREHTEVVTAFAAQAEEIEGIGRLWIDTLQRGGTIFFCGNGGSAADAQHLAAELVVRYRNERHSWPGLALTTDTSVLTAAGNDYGYEYVFSRQIEGLGKAGDLLVAISTSGTSKNVVLAAQAARAKGMTVVAMTGADARALGELADRVLAVPSTTTARIQEMHILAGHIWCEMVDNDAN